MSISTDFVNAGLVPFSAMTFNISGKALRYRNPMGEGKFYTSEIVAPGSANPSAVVLWEVSGKTAKGTAIHNPVSIREGVSTSKVLNRRLCGHNFFQLADNIPSCKRIIKIGRKFLAKQKDSK